VADLGADATAGDVVRRAIALAAIRLILHDPVVRLDADPEGVHQARVATRRLRSDLRTFRPLLDREWSKGLRDELGWIARILGDVRDGDVLLERLTRRVGELPGSEHDASAPVLATLARARDEAHADLLATLRSKRYVDLLDRLVDAARAPVFAEEASRAATDVVPGLVRRPWHKLAKRVGKLGDEPSDTRLHEVRIRTKRARYAAEASTPVVGKPARAFAQAAARLQDVLGDMHDAVVAAEWLDSWGEHRGSEEERRAAEALAAAERESAAELRASWRPVWEDLETPDLRSWM